MSNTLALWGGVYLFISCLLAGWMAQKKGDYFSRGFTIGLMAGIFAPIFFASSPDSHARAGDETDIHSWHVNGVFATMTHVVVIFIIWLIWFLWFKPPSV